MTELGTWLVASLVLVPSGLAAGRDGLPTPRDVGMVVAGHFSEQAPVLDRGMTAAAAQSCMELAEEPDSGMAGFDLDRPRLDFYLHRAGVFDAGVFPLVVHTTRGRWRDVLAAALDAPTPGGLPTPNRMGAAVDMAPDGTWWVCVLLVRRLVWLEPLPRMVEPGNDLVLRARLEAGAQSPEVLFFGPKGIPRRAETRGYAERFTGFVPMDEGMGVYQVEVLVHTDGGPTVAALFPVYAGMDPPTVPVVKLPPQGPMPATPAQSEAKALELVNQARLRFGLARVTPVPELTRAARLHSRQMRDRAFFGHIGPNRVRPEERVALQGLVCRRETENISIARDVYRGHMALMASPAHRMNILDPDVTEVGIGVVWSRGGSRPVFITQYFAKGCAPDD